jgi:hypothetical protein
MPNNDPAVLPVKDVPAAAGQLKRVLHYRRVKERGDAIQKASEPLASGGWVKNDSAGLSKSSDVRSAIF